MKSVLVLIALMLAIQWTYVTNSGVNLRKGPDNKKRILTTVPAGKELNVIEKTNEWWWQVEYNGKKGYIASAFISRSYPKTLFKQVKANPVASGAILLLVGGLVFVAIPRKGDIPAKKPASKKTAPKKKKKKS